MSAEIEAALKTITDIRSHQKQTALDVAAGRADADAKYKNLDAQVVDLKASMQVLNERGQSGPRIDNDTKIKSFINHDGGVRLMSKTHKVSVPWSNEVATIAAPSMNPPVWGLPSVLRSRSINEMTLWAGRT